MIEWLAESKIPLYSAAQVRELTGATPVDLQNWANRGIIDPTANKPGRGGRRLYSRQHVCIVATARWLLPLGMETTHAILCATIVFQKWLELLGNAAKRPGMTRHNMIAVAVNSVAFITSESDTIAVDIMDRTSPSFGLEVEKIIDTRASVAIPVGLIIGPILKQSISADIEAV